MFAIHTLGPQVYLYICRHLYDLLLAIWSPRVTDNERDHETALLANMMTAVINALVMMAVVAIPIEIVSSCMCIGNVNPNCNGTDI